MHRTRRSGALVLSCGVVLTGFSWAAWGAGGADAPGAPAPPDAVSEARLIEAALNGTTGFIASFTQTLESAALPRPQVERGTLFMLRPGRMRWEYDEPRGKIAIADGRRTILYLPEDRQVIVAPLASRQGEAAGSGVGLLLEPRVDLVGAFAVSWGPAPERDGARPLLLTPRAERAAYRSLLVEPDAEHLVQAITVVDTLGGRVTYRFSRMRRVPTLPDSLFRFTPPKGVAIQEVAP